MIRRKLDLVWTFHGMYRWFSVVPQGLIVFLPFFLLIEWVLGTELLAKGSPRGTPSIPKVSLWSVEQIGRSIARSFEFFPRAMCFSTVQAKLVWPVSQVGLSGLALWDVVKSFWARKSLSCYGCSCSEEERFLRQVFSWKGFWGVLDRTGLTGLLNRSDRFPLPIERLSPTEAVWPVSETGLAGFSLAAGARVVFRCVLSCGCRLGLAPRSSSTPVAAWPWQEKLMEVHKWNRVHRPNSWIEFLSALLTVKIRQPSHEFTFGVGMSFIPYPLVLTPVV
jgi:hypothetical protein